MNAKVRLAAASSFAAQISALEWVFEIRANTTLGDSLMNGFHWFSGHWVVYGLRNRTMNAQKLERSNRCLDTGLLGTSYILEVRNLYRLPVRVANPVLSSIYAVINWNVVRYCSFVPQPSLR